MLNRFEFGYQTSQRHRFVTIYIAWFFDLLLSMIALPEKKQLQWKKRLINNKDMSKALFVKVGISHE